MSTEYFSAVIHGESKVGKTELACTSPGRILYLDAEAGGFRFVDAPRIEWDPMREDVPEKPAKGGWKICRVQVKDELALSTAIDFLERGRHPFNSVVWDSVTEAQTYLKREVSASYTLDQQDWGGMLAKLEGYIMKLRDAVAEQDQLKSLVIIAQSAMRDDKRLAPHVQGAMRNKLPFKLDMTGYLFTQLDDNDEEVRGLRIKQNRDAVAGSRWPSWLEKPAVIWHPNIAQIEKSWRRPVDA